jgi:hypothetical protein
MAIVEKSVYSYPTAYTTSGSINGTKYKNAIGKGAGTSAVSGNDYSNNGSSSTAYIEYSFEFDIPENATIESVECQVKGHCENTSKSTAKLQLYAGSTAKGSVSKFTSTSAQTVTLTTGTWTRSEIDNLKLRFTIGYYGGLVNGATVTITYKYDDITYTITIDNSTATTVTANPTEVSPGQSSTIRADSLNGLKIVDNGTDITSDFVERSDDPTSYEIENRGDYGFELNSSGYYVSTNKGISKTAAVCRVTFNVPVSATVTFTYINYAEESYDFGVFGSIDTALSTSYYSAGSSGASITDSDYELACNTSTHNKSTAQTLTYQMSAGEHFIDVKYSKDDASDDNNDTLQFKVSITLNESYTPPTYYAYEIQNVQGNHLVVVTVDMPQDELMTKVGNTYKIVITAYKKVNGVWTAQSDVSVLYDYLNSNNTRKGD